MGIRSFCRVIVVSSLAAAGCDSSADTNQSDIAKALSAESKTSQDAKRLKEEKRAAYREEKQAQAKIVADRAAEIKAAMALPDPMPEDIEKACATLVESYDTFMRGGTEREILEWFEGRRKKMAKREHGCVQKNNVAAAACGSVALLAPLPSLKGVPRTKAAGDVIEQCFAFAQAK